MLEEHLVDMLSLVIKLNDRNFLQILYSGRLKVIKTIRTFLNFSSIYRWQTRKLDDDTTEVRLIDLRYLNKGHYSFAAIAHVDNDNNIDHSYIGWVFTEEKLQKLYSN